MGVIAVSGLKKYYRVHQKESGLIGSLKSLLRRRYRLVRAVDGISFEIEKGELVGFIGPNGAGKTTTMKCLSGLLYPDSGRVSVLGENPWERREGFLRRIALVMGQRSQLWWDLPPMETFILNQNIYRIPEEEFKKSLAELVDLLEVKKLLGIQTRKLSLGQRMKCELIASLLHQPEVLFLDEPTLGLDVVMQKKIRDFIKFYNQKHRATIILTSHYMGDVRELSQRVIIIDAGKIVFKGQLEEVVRKHSRRQLISLTLKQKIVREELEKMGKLIEFNFPQAKLMVKRKDASLLIRKILAQLPVAELTVEEPPIEEVIRQLFIKKNYS